MMQHYFVVNTCEFCVYSKLIGLDCVIIGIYVDGMLTFGTNVHVVNGIKNCCLLILK